MKEKFILLACLFHLMGSAAWPTTYHALRPGETLADVAKAYYGDQDRAMLLLQYNRIPDPKKIYPGTKIAIPTVIRYTVQKGDTLANLALRFLGDRRRHRALASINHLNSPQALSIGSGIKIPFDLPHIVKKGESLAMIADRYYGDPKKFNLITSYNFLTDPRAIKPGTEILVPIVDLEIVVKSTPKSESAKALLLPEEQVGFPWLENGINLYLAGEYRTAMQSLREAVKRGLEREDDICKAYRFLAYCHIALGETDLGRRAFERALVIRPNLELDPTYISPKIMRIFGKVKAEKRR